MSTETKLDVKGMTCAHCVKAVREALLAVPGVDGADVDLEGASATVTGSAADAAMLAAVEKAGYEITKAAV